MAILAFAAGSNRLASGSRERAMDTWFSMTATSSSSDAIGGGMDVDEAFALVKEHVTGKPLAANALIASEVISALFVGVAEAA
ncbi:gene transfer agent family protein [Bradyrhizobium diversitatis]|uniref:gene transfer agent family protein n=1 Tax=Bradyrhizobium diversitatis TaxID=2755406 RepID=UPI001FEB6F15|nr:gene transfer agent family protein [Bradyrhizobium diversitatis]